MKIESLRLAMGSGEPAQSRNTADLVIEEHNANWDPLFGRLKIWPKSASAGPCGGKLARWTTSVPPALMLGPEASHRRISLSAVRQMLIELFSTSLPSARQLQFCVDISSSFLLAGPASGTL